MALRRPGTTFDAVNDLRGRVRRQQPPTTSGTSNTPPHLLRLIVGYIINAIAACVHWANVRGYNDNNVAAVGQHWCTARARYVSAGFATTDHVSDDTAAGYGPAQRAWLGPFPDAYTPGHTQLVHAHSILTGVPRCADGYRWSLPCDQGGRQSIVTGMPPLQDIATVEGQLAGTSGDVNDLGHGGDTTASQ